MKRLVTRHGLQAIAGIGLVGIIGVLLCQRFGPFPRQTQNMAAAERFIPTLHPMLHKDARFADIKLYSYTGGKNGALAVYGYLASEQELRDLKRLVEASQPPVEVVYQVQVMPSELLNETSKTNTVSETK